MARFTNTSGGMLVLPDGTEIPKGAETDVSADMLKASGVAVWADNGWLDPVKAKAKDDSK